MQNLVSFLTLLGFSGTILAQISPPIPVPKVPHGLHYQPNNPLPAVQVEMFMELNCPYSRSGWATIKSVQEYYGADKLDILVQQLPLPYHRNAFLGTQGIFVIQDNVPSAIFAYIEIVLDNLEQFSTANTVDKTETQVLDLLADLAVQATGIDKALFTSQIGTKRSQTTALWKYGVKRFVAGTPTYFVNGVGVSAGEGTYDDWIAFLDPIIGTY